VRADSGVNSAAVPPSYPTQPVTNCTTLKKDSRGGGNMNDVVLLPGSRGSQRGRGRRIESKARADISSRSPSPTVADDTVGTAGARSVDCKGEKGDDRLDGPSDEQERFGLRSSLHFHQQHLEVYTLNPKP